MIDLSRHIEYLLLTDAEVAVQQLGVFRAECMPSRWVEEEHLLLPPYRTLRFEAKAEVNDTRLLHTLALKYKLTLQEAEIQRTEYVEHLKQELQDGGSADLGNIGVFVSEAGELLFIPCESGVVSPAYYGLDAIQLEPLQSYETNVHPKGRVKTLRKGADEDYFVIRIPKRVVHYAASVAAAALLFFAVSTPIAEQAATGEQTAHTSFFIPRHLLEAPMEQESPQVLDIPENPETPEMLESSEAPIKSDAPATPAIVPETSSPSYAVVLASAIPMQRAEAYAKELNARGIKAEARQFGKIVRVVIPGFSSADEVQEKIHELKAHSAEFDSAWTLKMH